MKIFPDGVHPVFGFQPGVIANGRAVASVKAIFWIENGIESIQRRRLPLNRD